MTRRLGAFLLTPLFAASAGCAPPERPEAVALTYSRALYARDLTAAYALLSSQDRAVKDEAAFRRERDAQAGFALEVSRQLAGFVSATPLRRRATADQVELTMRLRLPNANAPEVSTLVHEWDEGRLNSLPAEERQRVTWALGQLHQAGRLPMLEGEETFTLVREDGRWRILLNWAEGARVRFHAVTAGTPLQVAFSPEEVVVTPGERFKVTMRVTNPSAVPVRVRARHVIEPRATTSSLVLVLCLLEIPVTVEAGRTEEFLSEYVVLKDIPRTAKRFDVTYGFVPVSAASGGGV